MHTVGAAPSSGNAVWKTYDLVFSHLPERSWLVDCLHSMLFLVVLVTINRTDKCWPIVVFLETPSLANEADSD